MKKLIFITFLLLFAFSTQEDEETIIWTATQKLSWKNFKAPADDSSVAVAITASGISYQLSATITNTKVTANCKIIASFYPQKSWYKAKLADQNVLAHEQLHFDITELHARKLREKIAKATFTKNVREEVKILYDQNNEALQNMQKKYDAATNFSINVEKQRAWETLIEKELRKMKKYQ